MPDRTAAPDDRIVDAILENLVAIMPVFHRKILRMDLGRTTGDLTRLHLGIMAKLSEGDVPVSELAKVSIVAKPQMTHLISQLVSSGIVARHEDSADRRVTRIALTDKGRTLLEEIKGRVHGSIRSSLGSLSHGELAEMSEALETLRRIVSRL